MDTRADPLAGRLVDERYEILERVARGGMASVYRARDLRLERIVAVKIMHPHLAESTDFVRRFRREARAAARLSHPGVVAVHDQGVTGDSSYLAMEFVDGPNLRQELRARGSLTLGQSLDVVEQVLDALAAAHRAGLVHRDIKPENILVTAEGRVKVADFGLARAISETTAATSGTVLGTVAYIAPETVLEGIADPPADVYGVGVVAYELITGSQPFTGTTPAQVAFQHVNRPVPAPGAELSWVPKEVDDLVAALTAQDPDDRPADAGQALTLVRRVRGVLTPDVLDLRSEVAPRPPVDFDDDDDVGPEDPGRHGTADPDRAGQSVAIPIGSIRADGRPAPRRARTAGNGRSPAKAASAGSASSAPSPQTAAEHRTDARRTEPRRTNGTGTRTSNANGNGNGASAVTTARRDAAVRPAVDRTANATREISTVRRSDAVGRTGAHPAGSDDTRPIPTLGGTQGRTDPPGTTTKGARRRRRGVVLTSALAVLLLLAAGGWWLVAAGPLAGTTVPDVTGRPVADAVTVLEAEGFEPALVEAHADDVTEGNVISTDPAAGQSTRATEIDVVVSLGVEMLAVPDVLGSPQADAEEALTAARLTVGDVDREYHATVPEGAVISTDPAPGQVIPHDRPITLVVSDGREPAAVPDVVGEARAAAVAEVEDVGLVPVLLEEHSDTVAEGLVISQDPAQGDAFVGDEVEVVVSLGPELVAVPDLLNADVDEAIAELESLGLVAERDDILGAFYGTVRSQTPEAGALVERGTVITLRVV